MAKASPKELLRRARLVKVVLMDVDGVLADGRLFHFVDTAGRLVELKGIHAQDSIALAWLAQSGIRTGFISGRSSRGLEERAKMLKVSYVYQHRLDKKTVFDEICRKAAVEPEETVFIGDDLPDIPVITAAGLGIAVRNARAEVKAASRYVTRAEGGHGAVREAAELVLRARGLWKGILDEYQADSR